MTLFHLPPQAAPRVRPAWRRAFASVAVELSVCAATLAAIAMGAMLLR